MFSNEPQTDEMKHIIGAGFNTFKRDPTSRQIGNDYNIIMEALGAACTFIATLNLFAINHARLNETVRDKLGLNEDFIGLPDELSNRLLKDPHAEAWIIAAMSVSNTARDIETEMVSWRHFCARLGTTFRQTACLARQVLLNGETTEDALIESGRALAKDPRFVSARKLEEELQILRLDALAWGMVNGECELDEIEQEQVERHLINSR